MLLCNWPPSAPANNAVLLCKIQTGAQSGLCATVCLSGLLLQSSFQDHCHSVSMPPGVSYFLASISFSLCLNGGDHLSHGGGQCNMQASYLITSLNLYLNIPSLVCPCWDLSGHYAGYNPQGSTPPTTGITTTVNTSYMWAVWDVCETRTSGKSVANC